MFQSCLLQQVGRWELSASACLTDPTGARSSEAKHLWEIYDGLKDCQQDLLEADDSSCFTGKWHSDLAKNLGKLVEMGVAQPEAQAMQALAEQLKARDRILVVPANPDTCIAGVSLPRPSIDEARQDFANWVNATEDQVRSR